MSPGLADYYADACRLMSIEPMLATTSHLVSHLLREIESAVRRVLLPFSASDSVPPEADQVRADTDQAEGGSHREQVLAVIAALGLDNNEPPAQLWLGMIRKKGRGFHSWAHRSGLESPRPVDDEFRQFWTEAEALFDLVLDRFEAVYASIFARIDEIAAKPQLSKEDATFLAQSIPNTRVARDHLFSRILSPEALNALRARGFFDEPPEPEVVEGGGIRLVPWREASYLRSIASQRPIDVRDIILVIPPTENSRALEELVGAIIAMPANIAATLVDRTCEWATVPIPNLLPDQLGKLLEHLARGHQIEAAIKLARVLLAIRTEESPIARALAEEEGAVSRRPAVDIRGRFDLWDYRRVLEKRLPALREAAPEPTFDLLCDLLAEGLALDNGETAPEDLSEMWRTNVEDDPEGDYHGVENALVTAIRDAAMLLIDNNPSLLPVVVRRLSGRGWTIFRRVSLYLLGRYPAESGELLGPAVLDKAQFKRHSPWSEYASLVQSGFPHISDDDRQVLLTWIEDGLDEAEVAERIAQNTGREAEADEIQRAIDLWRLRRLELLEENLSPDWAARLSDLRTYLGEADSLIRHGPAVQIWTGPESPVSDEDLRGITVEQIVAFLKEWKPPGEIYGPSMEGLAYALQTTVAADAARFAPSASLFQGLHPAYVRSLLAGLRTAYEAGQTIDWPTALALCAWVVAQPRDTEIQDEDHLLLDPGWGWTRKSIADLIVAGLRSQDRAIPRDLDAQVWEVLQVLLDDPEPTAEYEAQYVATRSSLRGLTTGTIRGAAVDGAIRCLAWLRAGRQSEASSEVSSDQPFIEQEVWATLERHLDPAFEPALSVRGVFGLRLPLLVWLNSAWVRANLPRLFPDTEGQSASSLAVWEPFVVENRSHERTFELLREQYDHAVSRLADADTAEDEVTHSPAQRLGHHLLELYWNDDLHLGEPDRLLERFIELASPRLRREGLAFLGRSLQGRTDLPQDLLDRLRRIAEYRLEVADAAASTEERRSMSEELRGFGLWFASGAFDDMWSLDLLGHVLAATPRIDSDLHVLRRLAALSESRPAEAMTYLTLLVAGDTEGWHIDVWREEATVIFMSALASGDKGAERRARDLINRLVAKGNRRFEDLLEGL